MRKYFYLALLLILLVTAGVPILESGRDLADLKPKEASSQEQLVAGFRSALPGLKLGYCLDNQLGVKVLCDFGWKSQGAENARFFVLKDFPDVRFKVVKIETDIFLIQQLNREKLEDIGQYAKDFVMEETTVAGRKAIKVKAFSRENPDARLLDYYFVRDQALYGLMFSVNPKEQWDGYKFLFKFITDHFAFI